MGKKKGKGQRDKTVILTGDGTSAKIKSNEQQPLPASPCPPGLGGISTAPITASDAVEEVVNQAEADTKQWIKVEAKNSFFCFLTV